MRQSLNGCGDIRLLRPTIDTTSLQSVPLPSCWVMYTQVMVGLSNVFLLLATLTCEKAAQFCPRGSTLGSKLQLLLVHFSGH